MFSLFKLKPKAESITYSTEAPKPVFNVGDIVRTSSAYGKVVSAEEYFQKTGREFKQSPIQSPYSVVPIMTSDNKYGCHLIEGLRKVTDLKEELKYIDEDTNISIKKLEDKVIFYESRRQNDLKFLHDLLK